MPAEAVRRHQRRAVGLPAADSPTAPYEQSATQPMASITQCRYLLLKGEGEGRIAWLDELVKRSATPLHQPTIG